MAYDNCKSTESIRRKSLVLPKILFGSERQVQKAWRKVVRRAWNDKGWSAVFAELEMVSAEYVDALIVSSSPLMRSAHPDSWRMYVVEEGFKDVAFKCMRPGTEGMDDFDALLYEGMKHLWFTIGLLQGGGGRFNLSHFPRSRAIAEVLYDYVDRFAYWLPELVVFEDLFYDDFILVGGYIDRRCSWANSIVFLAADCDVDLPVEANWEGDILIDSLLGAGLIERFNGRYRAHRVRTSAAGEHS